MLDLAVRSGRVVRALARPNVRRAAWRMYHARRNGDWGTVTRNCQELVRSEPAWCGIWVELGRTQQRQNDYAGAEASYRRALEINDRMAAVHLRLGTVLWLQHRFSQAAASYFAAARLAPRSAARQHLHKLRYSDAEIDAALANGRPPSFDHLQPLDEAGQAWIQGNLREVARRLMGAVQQQPVWPELWRYLGFAQLTQGDLVAAEASYRRALALEPESPEVQLELGQVLKRGHRLGEAAALFFRAIQRDPRSPARNELAALGLSDSIIEQCLRRGELTSVPFDKLEKADRARLRRDWDGVAAHLSDALESNPGWPALWVYLGHAHKSRGDILSAEASYRRALTLEPDVIDTHLRLAEILELEERFDEAAANYFDAFRLAPRAHEGMTARTELIRLGYRPAAIDAALTRGSLAWPPLRPSLKFPSGQPILSIIGADLPPMPEPGAALPMVLRQSVRLPRGELGLFIDVQMISTRDMPEVEPRLFTDSGEVVLEPVPNNYGDQVLTFRAMSEAEAEAELIVRAALPADCLIRRLELSPSDHANVWPLPQRTPGPAELPVGQIRNLIIGTTGVCNASCPHCPTNKLVPSAQVSSEMQWSVFETLVEQIKENQIFVSGFISLGLFGDGLLDRQVVDRARLLRRKFPRTSLHVNTNAAAYNRAQHAALGTLIDILAVHVETLDAEKYRRLMAPLRLENVLPKVHQIVEDMAPIVSIAGPIHRENLEELTDITEYFSGLGVSETIFTPISNRCSRDEVFQALALNPKSGSCHEEIIFDLIVDWDGTVLVCCNDFLRREPIGNIAETPLIEILSGHKRRRVFEALRDGRWQELETCRTCKWDCRTTVAA